MTVVGGMSSLLPYGTGICHYAFVDLKNNNCIVLVHSYFIFFFNLVLINKIVNNAGMS